MKRTSAPHPLFNPFLLWTEIAVKTGEMMTASAQVISHRTGRMAMAGPLPSARDQREFTLMGQEKLEAVSESLHAMNAHLITINQNLARQVFKQSMATANTWMSIASSPTIAHSLAHQAKLMNAIPESLAAASSLAHSTAQIAARGLKPIHSRATANAKRLGKIKAF